MIIVEGPDGAGKTTLVERLMVDFPDLPLVPKRVDQNQNARVDLKQTVEMDLLDGRVWKLFDRHILISEFIYGPIFRDAPRMTDFPWVDNALRRLRALDPFVIFCLPPLDEVQKNIDGDATNVTVVDKIDQVYWSYFFTTALWDKAYIWNYTEGHFYPHLTAAIHRWREAM